MTAIDPQGRLERALPDILTAIAAPRVPDYVDDLLALAAVSRQRPRWTFPERWLPMGVIARRLPLVPQVPWRIVAVTAGVLTLAIAAALLLAGSRPRLPEPFGVARNGMILYTVDGDIHVRDSLTGEGRLLIGGPTHDFGASFDRLGQKVVFLRPVEEGGVQARPDIFRLLSANLDGSAVTDLSGRLLAPDWWDWSPTGASLVIQAGRTPSLMVIDASGSNPIRDIRVDHLTAMTFPTFRGPDGVEILFRGRIDPDGRTGLFIVRPDGTGFRALTSSEGSEADYEFPMVSPDGRFVTYTSPEPGGLRIHLLDLTSGADRVLDLGPPDSQSTAATFSPDGSQILFKVFTNDGRNQIMVADADGTSPAVLVGPSYRVVDGQYLTATFSPDGKSILVGDPATGETRIVDARTGGAGTLLPWAGDGITGWQRLGR